MFPSGDPPAIVRLLSGIVAALSLVLCIVVLCSIVRDLRTGETSYKASRYSQPEIIYRKDNPGKFESTLKSNASIALVAGIAAGASWWFFRKLGA